MTTAAIPVEELVLREIRRRLEAIDCTLDPGKWRTRVDSVTRGWVPFVDRYDGTNLALLATACSPWTERSKDGILAGGVPGKGLQERVLEIAVEAYVSAETLSDEGALAISADIETALLEEPTLGGLAQKTRWARTTRMPTAAVDGKVFGSLRTEFQVMFRTQFAAPGTRVA